MHPIAWKDNSKKFAKKCSYLAHLGDAGPWLKEYVVIVTWPTDRRVRVWDRYLPSS